MNAAVARRGFYVRMDSQVRCECGLPALYQVRVRQLKVGKGDRMLEFVQVMPLCEDCYQEFVALEGCTVFNTT